jgi:DNA primase catalytic core
MPTTIDQIKDRLDIIDLANRYTTLERAGSNGRMKGLCPLHQEKTPSFFVFPDSQRWHCFGCSRGGDLLDLVQAVENLDFATTLREMARESGVELKPLTEAQQEQIRLERETESVLGAFIDHVIRSLPGSPGEAYAASRGWTVDEGDQAGTVTQAGIGYYNGNLAGLRDALNSREIDLNAPAARAVLATPGQSIIYPHYRRGRVVYYASRSIEGKRHYNPKAELVGPRQLYLNHMYQRNAERVFVVEGQGDAVTLGQWGEAAVGMAGTGIGKELIKLLQRHKHVYVGVENNKAGPKAARKLASELGALTRMMYWPEDDANAWLKTGATARDLQEAAKVAPTWLDVLVDEAVMAAPEDANEAIREVFASLVHVDHFAITKLQDEICKRLDINKGTFTSLLRIARMDAGLDQNGRPVYEVIGGQICRRTYDRYGGESIQPLFNGEARIVADIVEDDGEEQIRHFILEGTLADGTPLNEVEVTADEFAKMGWVLDGWGARAMVAAGASSRDHLRTAIQTLSTDIETRHEYAHLGWRVIAGQRCYLSASGAVGREGVLVRLPSDLRRYSLPTTISDTQVLDGVSASLRFLDVGDYMVTIPLLAAMYLAPLSSIVPPAFTLWLFGTTGSMKSTATALAMCHYGEFSYNTPPPASWISTAFALRVKAFMAKDAPLWIDDYAAQSTAAGDRDLRKKAETLLREWGNRAGRSAGQADGSLRRTHDPRGLCISTAEQLPPNPSIHPRLYAVEIHPGLMTHGAGSNLTRAQMEDAPLYPYAMVGYLNWLGEQWDALRALLPELRHQYTERARAGMGQHLRSPANVAVMYLGWEMFIKYARDLHAVSDEDAEALMALGWDTLLSIGEHQDEEINREEDPLRMYYDALEQMLTQGTVYLRNVNSPDNPQTDKPTKARQAPNGEFLGWYDEQYWYLIDQAAYNAVKGFYRAGGTVFPDSARGVKVKLRESGHLHPTGSEPYRYRLTVGDQTPWVLRIARMDTPEAEG